MHGVNRYKLLYIEWMNKVLLYWELYSVPVMNHNGCKVLYGNTSICGAGLCAPLVRTDSYRWVWGSPALEGRGWKSPRGLASFHLLLCNN